jgi:hypothetical protein
VSVSYYGLPVRDSAQLGPILEGTSSEGHKIEVDAIRAAVKRCRLAGGDRGTLKWEGEGSYVFVDVLPDHVLVTHGTGGGEDQMDVLIDLLSALQDRGLHVWDPQQGTWFFRD